MKKQLLLIALMAVTIVTYGQSNQAFWKPTVKKSNSVVMENKNSITNLKLYELDMDALKTILADAPKRNSGLKSNVVVSFPDADGTLNDFRIFENSNMDPDLESRYPGINSYVGQAIDQASTLIYFSVSPLGVQTMQINADKPAVFIEPYTNDLSSYVVYRKADKAANLNPFECSVVNAVNAGLPSTLRPNADDGNLRTFRLALSVTGEYTVFFGGTKALALAAMNASMTRVNGVFEIDFNVHMNLIANDDLVIYTNAATDPYSVASTGANGAWNQELQTNLTNTIGSANYDIGHLFGASGGGGNAGCISCVCVNPTAQVPLGKGSGFTSPADAIPQGDNFDIDYVAHEMGHQFGGNHTFTFSSEGTIAQVEPGSGSTIMGYAGITGSTDIQPHSDAFFHAVSIQQITNYIKTTTCQVTTATGDLIPTANAGLDYTIPKGTPFMLTGVGTDGNAGDVLTYCWEQMDVGSVATTFPSVTATTGAAFKSFLPSTSPVRYFPQMSTIKTGATSWTWEAVPNVARALNFRLTVRDNHVGGPANNSDDMIVTVNATAGPFAVTVPNTAVSWVAGSTQTVTWNVAGTTANGVNAANVDILLSTDGGDTYPITILAGTPNDGTQAITVPNNVGTQNRIMVKGSNHIFFDISNTNFTILSGSSVLSIINTSSLASNNICAGSNLNVNFTTDAPGNAGNIFTAQLSDAAGSFASPVNIGTLSSINQGTIVATIPGGTAAGSGYRIRVISSNPVVIGTDNGANVSIFKPVGAAGTITGTSTVCQSQTSVAYSVPAITNAVTYIWTLPTGATITSGANTNSIIVSFSSVASSGNITVAGTNAGCGNGTVSAVFPVTVNPIPVAAGSITGTAVICQGQSGVAYSVPAISGATGYNWVLPSGATIATGANTNSITVNFSAIAASGPITVAGTNTCGTGTLSTFAVTTVQIPTVPAVTAGGPTSFCTGGSVVLSYTQAGSTAYQWRKDGTAIGGQTGPSYSATTTGVYDVIAGLSQTFTNATSTAIPDNNCTGGLSTIPISGYTGTVTSSAITVKINITHTWVGDLVIVLQAPNGAILGLSNLTGSSSNSGDNFTNTIFSDAGATVIPTSGAPYTGTYKPVAATFTNTCVTTTIATFAAIGGGAINPNGNWILKVYDRAAADVGTIDNWSITFPASVNDPCIATSNSIAVNANSTVPASVTIAANPGTTICSGTSVTFTATPTNGGATPSYQWKNGVNIVGSNNPVYTTSSLNNSDNITCVMTSSSGCATGSPATSNTLQIIVNTVDDGNACTTDACNTSTGSATHTPVNVSDGNACTTDACNTTDGTISHTPINTDDGNPCTTDGCSSVTGVFHTPVNTDDGNACTTDACNTNDGTITHTPVNIDDGIACTTDGCDTQTGVFHTPVAPDDGNPCTLDACNTVTGAITHTPVNTDDGNACTTDACNTQSGAITHTPVNTDDGDFCTTDGCNSITGVFHNPVNTSDGDVCTTDACNPSTGEITHTAISVDDGNACTTDGCNSITGVFHNPVNTDDGNACTTDACDSQSGAISHTPVNTDDNNPCTTDACDSQSGTISHTPVNVDDGNPCTTDGCDSNTGIFHTPVTTTGGAPVTLAKWTFEGAFVTSNTGTNAIVSAGSVVADIGSQTGGSVVSGVHTSAATAWSNPSGNGSVKSISSNNWAVGDYYQFVVNTTSYSNIIVSYDQAGSGTGPRDYKFQWSLNGTTFNDFGSQYSLTSTAFNSGTFNSALTRSFDLSSITALNNSPIAYFRITVATNASINGATIGTGGTGRIDNFTVNGSLPVSLDDGNPCTLDACNTLDGTISHTPVNTDDGNACTTDGCDSNTGIFHNPVSTDDGNACTTDGCDTNTGVFHNPVSTDDGNACTTDACDSQSGLITHDPISIDDNNACTTDGCDTSTGVFHNPVSTDDGDACTTDGCDSNSGGVFHNPVNTDDGNACTTDGCDSSTGVFHTPVNTDDGNACTTDACDPQTGAITHSPVTVDDGNACTTDACNSSTGAITHTTISVDDGNACTTDACNSSTGAITHIAISVDDGNACTTDACNSSTGSITHTTISVDDGDACTTDACNSSTGAITHTTISVDDGNACTTDACNSSTGAITHTAVNTDDNNACTTDACNSSTGAITHTPVNISDNNPCTVDACDPSTGNITHTPGTCGVDLYSNILLEAYYLGGGLMNNPLFTAGLTSNPLHADLITISAMQAAPPHNLVDAQTDTLHTNGNVHVQFGPTVIAGNSYYLKITHRNHIETWSANPVVLNSTTTFTFSDSPSKVFSGNETFTHITPGGLLGDGFGFALYCGDLTGEGSVDATDFLDLDPRIQNGDGGYISEDINGDGTVDATDFLWLDPNVQNGIGTATP